MPDFSNFRSIFTSAIKDDLTNSPVALLFSGGTDSSIILWSLLELGIKVKCYTFRLERIESDDIISARQICQGWNTPLAEVIIPYQESQELLHDITDLIANIQTSRKTAIECTWPFTYIAPIVTENHVWCGLNADDLYGSAKGVILKFRDKPTEFTEHRKRLFTDYNLSAWSYIEKLFNGQDKHLHSPYRHQLVINYLMQYNWQELNRPRQKMPAYTAFQDEFQRVKQRHSDNLQCGSRIREYIGRISPNITELYKKILAEQKRPNLI